MCIKTEELWTREKSRWYSKRYQSLLEQNQKRFVALTEELEALIWSSLETSSNYSCENEEELEEGIKSLQRLILLSSENKSSRIACISGLLESELPIYPLPHLGGKTFYLLKELISVKDYYELKFSNDCYPWEWE